MLVELRVENLGIISDLLLALGPGMTVITGETGAGKTLIVDALDLLCGSRADAALVRDGADEARVEGRFVDGDDEVVIARVIPAVGRTRGYIDVRLASATELAERGPALDAVGAAIATIDARAPFVAMADRLRALQIETSEAVHDIRVAAEEIVADPEKLAAVQQRRARLRELVRKYGPTLAEVQAYGVDARERLAEDRGHE